MLHRTRPLLPPPIKRRRGEANGAVLRNRECPAAVHAFLFPSDDIATQSDVCSAVLQVPSVGINSPAPGTAPVCAAAPAPAAVLTVWRDTTAAEMAAALFHSVRAAVDTALAAGRDEQEKDSAPAAYVIRISSGCVGAAGKAALCSLATVELRQVVENEPFVFPVRHRDGSTMVETPLSALPYRIGDPLFFTCTRVR